MRTRNAFIMTAVGVMLALIGATMVEAHASAETTLVTAAAQSRDGTCERGEFCYYFNSNEQGSISDFTDSIDNYGATQPGCYDFKGAGAGRGKCVKNNAASVWNRSADTVRVYFNSNFAGHHQDFAPGARGNLDATLKNQNASHEFLRVNGCRTDGTNTRPPSTILVYRVTHHVVERVDFKTYVKNVLPNEWPTSWPAESLKTGAVAVRSFGWYWALHSTRRTPSGDCYDVTDNTASQVYVPGSAAPSTNTAVDATWATRMTVNGNIAQAHYCSTSTACPAWDPGTWLSQVGSRDEAQQGWSYPRILHHWYDNVVLS